VKTTIQAVAAAVAVTTVGVGLLPAVASAAERKFHAHMNGYSHADNCTDWTWNSSSGMCYVIGERMDGASGKSFPFTGSKNRIRVSWNASNVALCNVRHDVGPLPAGYDRWMKVSTSEGNWLCGAVSSTAHNNDAFIVVDGEVHRQSVTPTSTDRTRLEQPGGPLFLFVSYHGRTSGGKHGYVFGLRGYLNY